jgi:hypothetical protein
VSVNTTHVFPSLFSSLSLCLVNTSGWRRRGTWRNVWTLRCPSLGALFFFFFKKNKQGEKGLCLLKGGVSGPPPGVCFFASLLQWRPLFHGDLQSENLMREKGGRKHSFFFFFLCGCVCFHNNTSSLFLCFFRNQAW